MVDLEAFAASAWNWAAGELLGVIVFPCEETLELDFCYTGAGCEVDFVVPYVVAVMLERVCREDWICGANFVAISMFRHGRFICALGVLLPAVDEIRRS